MTAANKSNADFIKQWVQWLALSEEQTRQHTSEIEVTVCVRDQRATVR